MMPLIIPCVLDGLVTVKWRSFYQRGNGQQPVAKGDGLQQSVSEQER
jgi:hypothetical protein